MLPGTSRTEVVMPASPRPNLRVAVCAPAGEARRRTSAARVSERAMVSALLELREHRLGAAHVEPGPGLDVELLDPAVLHHHAVALGTFAHAEAARVELEAHRAGELPVAVGQHADLARRSRRLPPRVHDEDVVHRHAHDVVHAPGADLRRLGDEAGQVLHGAGGREGARHGEEDDPLALEDLAQRDVLRTSVLHLLELQIERERVASLDRHVASLVMRALYVAVGGGGGNGPRRPCRRARGRALMPTESARDRREEDSMGARGPVMLGALLAAAGCGSALAP